MLCIFNPLIYAPGEFLIKIIDGDGIDGINIRASPAVLSTTKVGNNWTLKIIDIYKIFQDIKLIMIHKRVHILNYMYSCFHISISQIQTKISLYSWFRIPYNIDRIRFSKPDLEKIGYRSKTITHSATIL